MFRRLRKRLSKEGKPYPLDRSDERILPSDFQGFVITSDIDKTYLATEFDSIRKLLKTAIEPASDKHCVPGMDLLLRSLRRGGQAKPQVWPLYFVSASPPQMRSVLEEKMMLDGILTDGITFKDQWRLVRNRRPEQITEHRLYKLTALLLNRAQRPLRAEIQEILVGDDSETDAETYQLYAQLLEGSLSLDALHQKLLEWEATEAEQQQVLDLADRRDKSRVCRIYIHRTLQRDLSRFAHLTSPQLFFGDTSFSIALDALWHGWLREEEVCSIAAGLPALLVSESWKGFAALHPEFSEKYASLSASLFDSEAIAVEETEVSAPE